MPWSEIPHVEEGRFGTIIAPSSTALAIHDRGGPKITVTPLGGLSERQHTRLLVRVVQCYHIAIVPG